MARVHLQIFERLTLTSVHTAACVARGAWLVGDLFRRPERFFFARYLPEPPLFSRSLSAAYFDDLSSTCAIPETALSLERFNLREQWLLLNLVGHLRHA